MQFKRISTCVRLLLGAAVRSQILICYTLLIEKIFFYVIGRSVTFIASCIHLIFVLLEHIRIPRNVETRAAWMELLVVKEVKVVCPCM